MASWRARISPADVLGCSRSSARPRWPSPVRTVASVPNSESGPRMARSRSKRWCAGRRSSPVTPVWTPVPRTRASARSYRPMRRARRSPSLFRCSHQGTEASSTASGRPAYRSGSLPSPTAIRKPTSPAQAASRTRRARVERRADTAYACESSSWRLAYPASTAACPGDGCGGVSGSGMAALSIARARQPMVDSEVPGPTRRNPANPARSGRKQR